MSASRSNVDDSKEYQAPVYHQGTKTAHKVFFPFLSSDNYFLMLPKLSTHTHTTYDLILIVLFPSNIPRRKAGQRRIAE